MRDDVLRAELAELVHDDLNLQHSELKRSREPNERHKVGLRPIFRRQLQLLQRVVGYTAKSVESSDFT